jgi:hypothetical protein
MQRKALYIFLTLLLVTVLAALAQSPTSSAPAGGSETKDPYGATLDHPNPGSAPAATGQPYNSTNVNEGQTPATGTKTATTPAESSTTTSTSSNTPSDTSASTTPSTDTSATTNKSLPRTASDLPLLATIGLLALGGALTVRSIAASAQRPWGPAPRSARFCTDPVPGAGNPRRQVSSYLVLPRGCFSWHARRTRGPRRPLRPAREESFFLPCRDVALVAWSKLWRQVIRRPAAASPEDASRCRRSSRRA